MTEPERKKPRVELTDPEGVSLDALGVGGAAKAVEGERTQRHASADLSARASEMGDGAITAAARSETANSPREMIIEFAGQTFTLLLTVPAQAAILEALPQLDTTKPVALGDFIKLNNFLGARNQGPGKDTFAEDIHGLAMEIESIVGQSLLARTGRSAGSRYWTTHAFTLNGETVAATEIPGLENSFGYKGLESASIPELCAEISGEGFATTVQLNTRHEKKLLEIMTRLQGRPLTSTIALEPENDFYLEGSETARGGKFRIARRGLAEALKAASGRELLGSRIKAKKSDYPITENFSADGQLIEASRKRLELPIEIDDEATSSVEQGITDEDELFFLEALTVMDTTSPLVLEQLVNAFLDEEFSPDAPSEASRAKNARRAINGLIDKLKKPTGEALLERTGAGRGFRYWVKEAFKVNGITIEPSKLKVPGNMLETKVDPELVVRISGDTFAEVEMILKNHSEREYLKLLVKLKGRSPTPTLAIENGFHPYGTYDAKASALKKARRGVVENFKAVTGRDLLNKVGENTGTRYYVAETFTVDDQVVEQGKAQPLVTSTKGPRPAKKRAAPPRRQRPKRHVKPAKPSREPKPKEAQVIKPSKVAVPVNIKKETKPNIKPFADRLKPEQIHPLEVVLDYVGERDPAEISDQSFEFRRALAATMDDDSFAFDHRSGAVLALRTGILTNKHARQKRYIRDNGERTPLATLMEKADYSGGLNTASVSAILGLRPSTVLAVEMRFLEKVIENNPTLPEAKSLYAELERQHSAMLTFPTVPTARESSTQ